jgi:hypothetical protein
MKMQKIDYIGATLCILIAVSFFVWAIFRVCSAYIDFKTQPKGRPSRLPFVPLIIKTPSGIEVTE